MGADVEGAETAVKLCAVAGCARPRGKWRYCHAHSARLYNRGLRPEIPIGQIARDGQHARGVMITDAGRAYLHPSIGHTGYCSLCGAHHNGPRDIGIVGSFLVVCYGAEYARMALRSSSSLGVLRKAGAA